MKRRFLSILFILIIFVCMVPGLSIAGLPEGFSPDYPHIPINQKLLDRNGGKVTIYFEVRVAIEPYMSVEESGQPCERAMYFMGSTSDDGYITNVPGQAVVLRNWDDTYSIRFVSVSGENDTSNVGTFQFLTTTGKKVFDQVLTGPSDGIYTFIVEDAEGNPVTNLTYEIRPNLELGGYLYNQDTEIVVTSPGKVYAVFTCKNEDLFGDGPFGVSFDYEVRCIWWDEDKWITTDWINDDHPETHGDSGDREFAYYNPVPEKYAVNYEWTGDVPADAILPTDGNAYEWHAKPVVDGTYTADTSITGEKDGVPGIYTFSGWDATDDADLTENGIEGDITYKGEWIFTPNTYKVDYEWTGDVPADVVIPTDEKEYKWHAKPLVDRTYTADTSVTGEKDGVPGSYKFSGWDASDDAGLTESGIEGDVTFKGEWTFTPGVLPSGSYGQLTIQGSKIWKSTPTVDKVYLDVYTGKTLVYIHEVTGEGMEWAFKFNLPRWNSDGTEIEYKLVEREITGWVSDIELVEEKIIPADESKAFKFFKSARQIDDEYTVEVPGFLNVTYELIWKNQDQKPGGPIAMPYALDCEINCTFAGINSGWLNSNKPAFSTVGGEYEWAASKDLFYDVFPNGFISQETIDKVNASGGVFWDIQGRATKFPNVPIEQLGGRIAIYVSVDFTPVELKTKIYTITNSEIKYKVDYEWSGDVPANAILPTDDNTYNWHATPVVDGTYTADTSITGEKDGVSGIYTFSGWNATDDADLTENGMEGDVTYKGEWRFTQNQTQTKYKVDYKWTGDVPANAVLPTDSNAYEWHATPVVDKTYTSKSSIRGKKGGVPGIYRFSGWDASDDTEFTENGMEGDVTFKGKWRFIADTYKVYYKWTGDVPVDTDIPTDSNEYEWHATPVIDEKYTLDFSVRGEKDGVPGIYTFSGWDATDDADLTENGMEGDVTFKAEWTFTPDTYKVDYEWNGDVPVDTDIPTDSKEYEWHATPVIDEKYILNFSVRGEKDGVPGIYTFSGWNASDDADLTENGMEGDVTYKGEWTFTPDPVGMTEPTKPASPATGDNSNILIWVSLLCISGGVLVGTYVFIKKQ